MRKTKQVANHIKEPADVWELEHYLTERRKEIDRKGGCRSQVLEDDRIPGAEVIADVFKV